MLINSGIGSMFGTKLLQDVDVFSSLDVSETLETTTVLAGFGSCAFVDLGLFSRFLQQTNFSVFLP